MNGCARESRLEVANDEHAVDGIYKIGPDALVVLGGAACRRVLCKHASVYAAHEAVAVLRLSRGGIGTDLASFSTYAPPIRPTQGPFWPARIRVLSSEASAKRNAIIIIGSRMGMGSRARIVYNPRRSNPMYGTAVHPTVGRCQASVGQILTSHRSNVATL